MQAENIRVWVIEPEILIAMDIERVLTEYAALQCAISFPAGLSADDADGTPDLVICATDDDSHHDIQALRRLATGGAAIVLLTTSDEFVLDTDLDWPCVFKPYDDDSLVLAVGAALKARRDAG